MRQLFLINFLLVAFINLVAAQQDTTTLYQSTRGYLNDPLRVNWKREITSKNNIWVVSMYNKKNNLQEQVSFEDKNLEVRKGPYLFQADGYFKITGNYDKGLKVGEWVTHYTDQKIKEKANYKWDLYNGTYESYWRDGSIKKSGTYLNGKRIGEWKMYFENGKVALEERFDNAGKLQNANYFNEQGEKVDLPVFFTPPSFEGGMRNFYNLFFKSFQIARNKIPVQITQVFVDCTINADGSITQIAVRGSDDEYLNKEIIRVVKLVGNWLPAKELGDEVAIKHVVPINFVRNKK